MSSPFHAGLFDQFDRGLVFAPRMVGDVGHDLNALVGKQDMTWLDWIIARLIFSKEPILVIMPFGVRNIRTGLHLVMRSNIWCEIKARSSTAKRKLTVIGGNIDSRYTGELYTVLHNIGLIPRVIRNDERYSQVIFHRAVRPEIHPVTHNQFIDELESHEGESIRGMAGFGSTGK